MKDSRRILAEFSMSPLDKGESLSQYVAQVLEIVDQSDLDYELHAMGTLLEGPWDEVFDVIEQCHQLLEKECRRISTTIKIDYRAERNNRIHGKVDAVKQKLGK